MASTNRMKITVLCYGETEPQSFTEITKMEFYKDTLNQSRVNITVGNTGRPIPFYVDDLVRIEAM